MLRLVALPMVNQIACTRDVVLEKLRRVDRGDFAIGIEGQAEREDDEVKRQIKPLLQRILRERIGQLDCDLEAYGVDTH
jgi:hypothetical protein